MYTYSDIVASKTYINFSKHHKSPQHKLKQTEKQTKEIYNHRMKQFFSYEN